MENETITVKPKGKGGRPKKVVPVDMAAVLQSPEAQAVISAAVSEATAKIVSELAEKRAAAGTQASSSGDFDIANKLAMAISNLSDQGGQRKRVAPEVMVAREKARDLMEAILIEYRSQDIVPEYELLRPVYLEERLVPASYTGGDHIQRRTKIAWPLVPNEAMHPTNDAARKVYAAFIASIGGETPSITEKSNVTALKVLHKDGPASSVPLVGKPRGNLEIIGRSNPQEIVETNVLGSIARPARQLA